MYCLLSWTATASGCSSRLVVGVCSLFQKIGNDKSLVDYSAKWALLFAPGHTIPIDIHHRHAPTCDLRIGSGCFSLLLSAKTLPSSLGRLPRRLSDDSRCRQETTKTLPRRLKMAQDPSKTPQEASQAPQDSENRAKIEQNWHENRCQDGLFDNRA